MKSLFLKIWPYLGTLTIVIAVSTVIYNYGYKSERGVDNDSLVLYKIEQLTKMTSNMRDNVDTLKESQKDIKKALSDMQQIGIAENIKLNKKIDCIVDNMPDNDQLIRQLYEIEKAIEKKMN